MASISRRDAGKILLAGCAGALAPIGKLRGATMVNSVFRGVQIGIQSCSFRSTSIMPLDAIIKATHDCGIGECELWEANAWPLMTYDEMGKWMQGGAWKKWVLETPASYFEGIRKKFDDAGIDLAIYNTGFNPPDTDEVYDHLFMQAKAMGVRCIGASRTQISELHRIDKFAQKHKMNIGIHPHDIPPKGEWGAATLPQALVGVSDYIGISLDVGHFTAGGGDAIAFIKEHHAKIRDLHLKDRRKNHGEGVPGAKVLHVDKGQGGRFGTGDSNIAGILRLVRDNGWKFPCEIEMEYAGLEEPPVDPVEEVRVNFAYCKKILES